MDDSEDAVGADVPRAVVEKRVKQVGGTPVSVVDRSEVGKEAMTKVVEEDGEELLRKILL